VTPDEISRAFAHYPLIEGVDVVSRGHVRVETRLRYPDGSSIDVFVLAPPSPSLFPQPIRLSDLGQTTAWLLHLDVRPWKSKKRSMFVDDVARAHGVVIDGGALTREVQPGESLPAAILALAQVCLRVADLTFTRRQLMQSEFFETVEDFFSDADLTYETNVEVPGLKGSIIKIDFRVVGRTSSSLVQPISTRTPSMARGVAVEAFRKWYDIAKAGVKEQRVTLLDDEHVAFREEDVDRLNDVSIVLPFSAPEQIRDFLAAA
jgi:hypothetical protein